MKTVIESRHEGLPRGTGNPVVRLMKTKKLFYVTWSDGTAYPEYVTQFDDSGIVEWFAESLKSGAVGKWSSIMSGFAGIATLRCTQDVAEELYRIVEVEQARAAAAAAQEHARAIGAIRSKVRKVCEVLS